MTLCILVSGGGTITLLILLLVFNCQQVESSVFQCPECDSHCTSEYAIWGFLIVSLPLVLFFQYIVDRSENGRQPRIMFVTNSMYHPLSEAVSTSTSTRQLAHKGEY
jgi:hypothetical protein